MATNPCRYILKQEGVAEKDWPVFKSKEALATHLNKTPTLIEALKGAPNLNERTPTGNIVVNGEVQPIVTEGEQQGVQAAANVGAGQGEAEGVGIDRGKSDADIEKRMLEIQDSNPSFDSSEQKEFNALEKEMEKRERATVFNAPLEKVNDAVDALIQKEKDMPNGFGSFIEKRDARETKEVADRYLNAKELTNAELKKDFSDAVRGNPTTWYADGLKMREALKEATNRGIDTKVMLAEVSKVYTDAGYDIETAKSVVAGMLKPVLEGSQKVNEKQIAEQPLKETPQVGSVVGGEVETKKQIENFGVNKSDVEPVHSVISQVFNGLKKAGLTATKTVGEWVGIGKGKEKPYSLKINGKDAQVKNVQPEVVNGFYSLLEKTIAETKSDKLPAKQWIEKFAKGEEAKWTGLADWLAQQQGSVSKADIQQYLKDNRISVVEVVKGAEDTNNWFGENDNYEKDYGVAKLEITNDGDGDGGWMVWDGEKKIDYNIFDLQSAKDVADNYAENQYGAKQEQQKDTTKFSQYQLEGEKENYKEVLVTMPNRELSKKPNWNEKQVSLNLSSKGDYSENQKRWTATIDGEEATITELPEKGQYVLDYRKISNAQFDTFNEAEKYITDKQSQDRVKGKSDFKSSHFDEPNILVHLRMNTRVDAEGKKVLFLEEVQSDWGQQGKKEGFKGKDKISEYDKVLKELLDQYNVSNEDELNNVISRSDSNRLDRASTSIKEFDTSVPTAPFVTDTNAWTKLGLKVALKEAVRQGADKIAWTTGEQQNDRYDLSKSVDNIEVSNQGEGVGYKVVGMKGGNVLMTQFATAQQLPDVIGKELAEKIIDAKIPYQKTKTFSGVDLKVGGKGMKGFYGSPTEGSLGIVGNVAKSLFKQEPKTIDIDANERGKRTKDFDGLKESLQFEKKLSDKGKTGIVSTVNKDGSYTIEWNENKPSTQHSIDITPELKASVEGGQPLFKDAEAQYRIENGKNIVEAIKDFNGSPRATVALTHEIMHPTVVAIIDGAKEGNEVGAKHTETIVNEFNKANPNNKVTTEDLIKGNDAFKNGTTSKQYRAVQEFIAESWEKYHTEGGKGFSKAFQEVLEQITKAFKAVYQSISGTQLTPELREMFDEILGKEQLSNNDSTGFEDVDSANTAKDLAKLYRDEQNNPTGIDIIDLTIADHIPGDINRDSYSRFGDPNKIGFSMAKTYFAKAGEKGTKIDQVALEASNTLGREITPDDVVAFMEKYPNGMNAQGQRDNAKLRAIGEKYKAITGKNLNKTAARSILEKENTGQQSKLASAEEMAQKFYDEYGNDRDAFLASLDDEGLWTIFPFGYTKEEFNQLKQFVKSQQNGNTSTTGEEISSTNEIGEDGGRGNGESGAGSGRDKSKAEPSKAGLKQKAASFRERAEALKNAQPKENDGNVRPSATTKEEIAERKSKTKKLKYEYDSAQAEYAKKKEAFDKNAQQNQAQMFGATPQDEMLFKNNLKEQKELLDKAKAKVDKTKAEYLESKKVLDDMLEGQAAITFADNLRDKAAELRASSGQGLSVLPNALATAYEVFADILDAASDIKEAIRQWKETKEYKALSEQDAKAADQAIADEFGEIETTESIFSQVDDAINKTGVEATTARRAMKEKFGIDNYQKAIKITREFDKITDRLDAEGKITKKCP